MHLTGALQAATDHAEEFGAASAEPGRTVDVPDAFLLKVLAAVAEMALRSKRRQADVWAALRRAGSSAPPAMVAAAVRAMEDNGWVDKVVWLIDGGVLLTVTSLGLERLARSH